MSFMFTFLRQDWWVYCIVVLTFFIGALALNYAVKKINDARLEGRFIRLRNKTSASRATQVQEQLESSIPSKPPMAVVVEQSSPPVERPMKGISLVFNTDENSEDGKSNDYIDIRDAPDSKWLLTISDVADISTGNDALPSNCTNDEINAQAFLGSIYKELNITEKSKSLSTADRDLILDQIVDKIKKQESKSSPSLIKLLACQDEDLKKWAVDLVNKKTSEARSNTSV